MATKDKSIHTIEKFDGKYFGFWRMQIEDYLYGKKMHQLLLLNEKPTIMTKEIGSS